MVALSCHRTYRKRSKMPLPRSEGNVSALQSENVGKILRSGKIQPKLTVGSANDPLEQQADKMADHVLKQQSSAAGLGVSLPLEQHQIESQPLSSSNGNLTSDSGKPLEQKTAQLMGQSLGTDFSQVRIHIDQQSESLNQQYGARAFTYGRDIYFDRGEYQPGTHSGNHLIAHELTHVVQQAKGSPQQIQRSDRPWPLNGRVINNSAETVTVWDDSGFSRIASFSSSARFSEDIDYIQDKHGQWYKIGVNTVTVNSDGELSGFSCLALSPGGPCIPGDRFVPPSGPGDHTA
jgi:hypothetical protein